MGVVSVSMPEELLDEIDALVEEHDYSGRSEVVRDAGRKLVGEFADRRLEDRPLAAVITALYPYDSPDIERTLTEVRHRHGATITSTSHSCLGGDRGCLETFVIEGDLDAISDFVRDIEAVDESVRVDHSLYPIDDVGEDPMGVLR